MVPRQISDTFMPLAPSTRYRIFAIELLSSQLCIPETARAADAR